MSVLIDTDVASLLRDGDHMVRARMAGIDGPPLISLLTLVELRGGLAKSAEANARRRARLEVMLRTVEVVGFERTVADVYGGIVQAIGFSRPRILDRLIAATAIVHGLTLVTNNGPDFRDIPGLELEVWASPAQ